MALFISTLACGLPSLPVDVPPAPNLDMSATDVLLPEPDSELPKVLACIPGEITCLNSDTELICTEDGKREIQEPCDTGMTCRFGGCTRPREVCQQGDVGLKLSETEVLFRVDANGKSESRSLWLANCGKEPVPLSSVKWVTPFHEDGSPVFDFDQRQQLQGGMMIAPGAQVPFTLEFHPRSTSLEDEEAWHEYGELNLSVVDGATRKIHSVKLGTDTWCLSSPPKVELGEFVVGEPQDIEIPIRNCGTNQVLMIVAMTQGGPGANLTFEPLTNEQGRQADLHAALAPGEEITLRGQLRLEEPGLWAQDLVIATIPGQTQYFSRFSYTKLTGAAVDPDICAETHPELLLDGQPVREIEVSDTWEFPTIGFDSNFVSPWTVHYEVEESPDAPGSHLALSDGKSFLMWPRSLGEYRVRATLFDPQGVRACDRPSFTIRYRQPTHWRVELYWEVEDDTIALDEGPGRGMDVDLHLRYRDPGAEGWHEPASSCWGAQGPCAQGRAALLHASDSGSSPETIVWEMASDERVELMAHLKNAGPFSVGKLTARIWSDGMLLQEVSESLDASGESWCIAWGGEDDLMVAQEGARYSRLPAGCE